MEQSAFWLSLADRLPDLVEDQFSAYRRLMLAEGGMDDGPRDVIARENARKAALAHLQALIRVYDLVQGRLAAETEPSARDERSLPGLLAEVRRELAGAPDDDEEFGE
jgi:hypothetical protein